MASDQRRCTLGGRPEVVMDSRECHRAKGGAPQQHLAGKPDDGWRPPVPICGSVGRSSATSSRRTRKATAGPTALASTGDRPPPSVVLSVIKQIRTVGTSWLAW